MGQKEASNFVIAGLRIHYPVDILRVMKTQNLAFMNAISDKLSQICGYSAMMQYV